MDAIPITGVTACITACITVSANIPVIRETEKILETYLFSFDGYTVSLDTYVKYRRPRKTASLIKAIRWDVDGSEFTDAPIVPTDVLLEVIAIAKSSVVNACKCLSYKVKLPE